MIQSDDTYSLAPIGARDQVLKFGKPLMNQIFHLNFGWIFDILAGCSKSFNRRFPSIGKRIYPFGVNNLHLYFQSTNFFPILLKHFFSLILKNQFPRFTDLQSGDQVPDRIICL